MCRWPPTVSSGATCTSASRAREPTAPLRRAGRAGRCARGAHRRRRAPARRPPPGCRSSSSPTRGPCSVASPPGCTATRPATCACSASPAPTARPRRRTCSTRRCARPAGRPAWSAPSRPASATTRVPSVRTTPEAPDLQALLAVMRERGVARVRDGGVQPRAGPGPGRRHRLRRGGLHQPQPGPPRLPPRPGGLLRGQGVAVHAGPRPASVVVDVDDAYGGAAGARARTRPGRHRLAGRAARADWRRPSDVASRAAGRGVRGSRAAAASGSTSRRRCPAPSTSPTPRSRSSRCALEPGSTPDGSRAGVAVGAGRAGADGAGAQRAPGRRSRSSTTRTARTPSTPCSTRCGRRPRRRAARRGRRCGGDRDRDEARRDGRGRRPARRRRRPHRRQPALARTRRTSSPRAARTAPRAVAGRRRAEVVVEPDRRAAIAAGGRRARRPGDVVVVAGKGHETGPGGRRRGASRSTTGPSSRRPRGAGRCATGRCRSTRPDRSSGRRDRRRRSARCGAHRRPARRVDDAGVAVPVRDVDSRLVEPGGAVRRPRRASTSTGTTSPRRRSPPARSPCSPPGRSGARPSCVDDAVGGARRAGPRGASTGCRRRSRSSASPARPARPAPRTCSRRCSRRSARPSRRAGSFNNEIGLPLTVLRADADDPVPGRSRWAPAAPGHIAYLCRHRAAADRRRAQRRHRARRRVRRPRGDRAGQGRAGRGAAAPTASPCSTPTTRSSRRWPPRTQARVVTFGEPPTPTYGPSDVRLDDAGRAAFRLVSRRPGRRDGRPAAVR